MQPGWGNDRFDQLPPALLVALGATAGTSMRWAIEESAAAAGLSTSVAIMALNVGGSALVGWLSGAGHRGGQLWRLAAVGFGGGLTTFSSYALDIARRLDGGEVGTPATVGATTVMLALLAAFIAHSWAGARSLPDHDR